MTYTDEITFTLGLGCLATTEHSLGVILTMHVGDITGHDRMARSSNKIKEGCNIVAIHLYLQFQ